MVAELLPDVTYVPPEGTYLAWLDFRPLHLEADDLAGFFRESAQVAVVNGRACGEAGQGFVRLNFAMPRPLLEQTVHRLARAVGAIE